MNTKVWGLVFVFFTTSLCAMQETYDDNNNVPPFDLEFSALEPPPKGKERSKVRAMLSARTRSTRKLKKGSNIRRNSESSKDFQVALAAIMQRLTALELKFKCLEKAQKRSKKKQKDHQIEQLSQQIQSLEAKIFEYVLTKNTHPYELLGEDEGAIRLVKTTVSVSELSEDEQFDTQEKIKKTMQEN